MNPFLKLCLISYMMVMLPGSFLPAPVLAQGRLHVAVSILPQKYFVERISGNLADVSVMVEWGANPHLYEPKPLQMAALAETAVYFAIGVGFEDVWLKKISEINPQMIIVQTDRGIRKRPMDTTGHQDLNRHHPSEKKISPDPHVWTSPSNVMILAQNILNGLITVDPASKSTYSANYRRFIDEIHDLDTVFKRIFSGKEGLEFMVFHPAWGYFADAYGIRQVPVEIEGKEPKPAQLKHLIMHARERGIKVIFAQPQISLQSARTLAKAIGGEVVLADPLAENWMESLKVQAENFRAALR